MSTVHTRHTIHDTHTHTHTHKSSAPPPPPPLSTGFASLPARQPASPSDVRLLLVVASPSVAQDAAADIHANWTFSSPGLVGLCVAIADMQADLTVYFAALSNHDAP
ncbi:hypothetical protein P3342_002633 [Pyrenophora teres f. teres]|nr:hypothetical protein P3342_002633 [Pyrenophora teres f. teres]